MRNWQPKVPKAVLGDKVIGVAKIGIVVATYDQPLLATLASIQEQTHENFVCLIFHDGPPTEKYRRAEKVFGDDERFVFRQHGDVRSNKHGHPARRYGLDILTKAGKFSPDLVCTTNGDNYYAPVFLAEMGHAALSAKSGWAICDMVHSHRLWQPVAAKCERKFVDAASWMAKTSVANAVVWDSYQFAADWDFCSRVRDKFGEPAVVRHTLLVHN